LKRQAEKSGNAMNIKHQQIANDLNTSREVVSRLLKKMEKEGMLTLNRNLIDWKGDPNK
jgi:CRP/FNR family transcriptional regulator